MANVSAGDFQMGNIRARQNFKNLKPKSQEEAKVIKEAQSDLLGLDGAIKEQQEAAEAMFQAQKKESLKGASVNLSAFKKEKARLDKANKAVDKTLKKIAMKVGNEQKAVNELYAYRDGVAAELAEQTAVKENVSNSVLEAIKSGKPLNPEDTAKFNRALLVLEDGPKSLDATKAKIEAAEASFASLGTSYNTKLAEQHDLLDTITKTSEGVQMTKEQIASIKASKVEDHLALAETQSQIRTEAVQRVLSAIETGALKMDLLTAQWDTLKQQYNLTDTEVEQLKTTLGQKTNQTILGSYINGQISAAKQEMVASGCGCNLDPNEVLKKVNDARAQRRASRRANKNKRSDKSDPVIGIQNNGSDTSSSVSAGTDYTD